jgi:predicted ATPase/tetratricopeptide (TPR) repeat protein
VAELPQGTVTFLFTDLEGSTRLWEDHPDEMRDALAAHDAILRRAIESAGGVVFSEMGDGMAAAFGSAGDAVSAAIGAQLGLGTHDWGTTGPLRARMGLHSGEGALRPDGHYVNQPLNRCARLMAVAHGGQVVVSETVETLVRGSLPPDTGLVDLGEHRLRDLSSAIGVFQVTHPALPRDFPPLQSLDSLPGNLPVQLTSFVGREHERKRIADELRDAHVVTLTGVGGVGKTRLALEVAADVIPEYRAGAWFVELAGVRDPEALGDAIMATFGLQVPTGMSVTDALLEFLRSKELLLVIDNCEHMLRPVADLVGAVARGCPNVRVLATSREGLNVTGERMLGVASLEVPDDATSVELIAVCDAVALFVDRARAVKANFALDDSNAPAVAQICRRLDGIALAIELAAARVAMLTPSEIARRLDQRFRLLAGGQRSTVERHQTLRATVDWSYELLGEAEQVLLDRLSVFAGGFTLEAAEAVTAAGVVEASDVFDLVATLVARSLVVADTEGIDARYRLLETIRQYAQEHLDESGDGDRLRTEHAAYYAVFAEAAMAGIAGPDGIEWERRFEAEFDNLRTALTWAVDSENVDVALRLFSMWASPVLWADVSLISTARGVTDAIGLIPDIANHPKYPRALAVTAFMANARGDLEVGRRLCDEASAAEQRLGTEPDAFVHMAIANGALAASNFGEMVDCAGRAAELAKAGGDLELFAHALGAAALGRALAGDAAGALADAEEVLAVVRRIANPYVVQMPMAQAAFGLGYSDPARALVLARETVALDPRRRTALPMARAGDLAARNGEYREALEYFLAAARIMQWQGVRYGVGTVLVRIGTILADRDPEAATVIDGAGEALAPGFGHTPDTVTAREQAVATATATLGEARRAELYTQGSAMTDDEAMAYVSDAISRYLAAD